MDPLKQLTEPAYTGENRCLPCTVVNTVLVGVAAALLYRRERTLTSLAVAAIGAGLVYLRGYVVPYTPKFAPRLVEAAPIPSSIFHDGTPTPGPEASTSLGDVEDDGDAVLDELAAAGVVTVADDTVELTDAVDSSWHDEMQRLAALSDEELATEIERTIPHITDAEPLDVEDQLWFVLGANDEYLSQLVAITELGAYRALESSLDDSLRLAGARSLRMFLSVCPVCGSEIVPSTEANCCGAYADSGVPPKDLLVCPECEQRVFEFPAEDSVA
ncbi:hypothetical protein [Halorhabdus sp. CUG00001]|uniref:hypothetical protein n=1 Tax=Halorhabdus sp. CUG00001 TaxID=2600297 RepID=UPI00131E84B9|nr:hypothetical protein [Halorhabdus sp. CUG00001]